MLTATASAAELISLEGRAMGTTWIVKFVPPTSAKLDPDVVRARMAARLEELEQQFSTYRPGSEISRFNTNRTTDWIAVSPEVVEVAAVSRRISELTGGAFDVTVGPLVQLWGFGAERRTGAPPTEDAIAAAREHVGWQRLETRADPAALRKSSPSIAVDFSSVAKGYAADAIGELLASMGVENSFVQIGGDVKAQGSPAGGTGWRVGVEEPRDGTSTIACVVELAGQSLSTSGTYRNFVTLAGRRYGHIIAPRAGRPVDHGLAAVSVVHPSCAWSSALATALFVLGPEEGRAIAEREKLAVAFFVREGAAVVRRDTPEFARRLVSPNQGHRDH